MEMIRWQLQGHCIYKYRSVVGCMCTWIAVCVSPTIGDLFTAETLQVPITKQNQVAAHSEKKKHFENRSGKTPLCSIHSLITLGTNDCLNLSADIVESVNLLKWLSYVARDVNFKQFQQFHKLFWQFFPSLLSTSSYRFPSAVTKPHQGTLKRTQRFWFSLTTLLLLSIMYVLRVCVLLYVWAAPPHRPMFYGVCTYDKSTEELKCFSTMLKAMCQH